MLNFSFSLLLLGWFSTQNQDRQWQKRILRKKRSIALSFFHIDRLSRARSYLWQKCHLFFHHFSQGLSPNSILPRLSTNRDILDATTHQGVHTDPHLSPRMTSPVVELLRRDKYTLGVGHEAFSNGRTKLPLVNNNHRRVSLSRIVRSARLLLDPRRREKLRATFGDENIGSKSLFLFESSSTSPMN